MDTQRRRTRLVVLGSSILLICSGLAQADLICVPDEYPTIQEAIDAAVDGDEISVGPGKYNEAIDFLGKAVRLYSSDGPEVTIVDATGLNASVVMCVSGEGPDTILEGFTITGGSGTWHKDAERLSGGGMLNLGSSPTVDNCLFWANEASETCYQGNWGWPYGCGYGGGMYNGGSSSPTVMNCSFLSNSAGEGSGGAMYNDESSPTVTACEFSGNSAGRGGGMCNSNGSSPTVTSCTFAENVAGTFQGQIDAGGGMYNVAASNPTVRDCTFAQNSADDGGGMANHDSSPTVKECTFTGNDREAMKNTGGTPAVINCKFSANLNDGMWNARSSPTVIGCTFVGQGTGMRNFGNSTIPSNPRVVNCRFIGNSERGMYNSAYSAPKITNCTFLDNGWGVYSTSGSLTAVNSIFWGNGHEQIQGEASVSFSDIEGGYPGAGNVDADPLCDEDGRPQPGSPCIDAGHNWGVPKDTEDLDDDGDTGELIPFDLDGNPRFNADELDFDPGCGIPVVVDMGAYEYQFDPVEQVLFADVNGDGAIGFDDLNIVLSSWGDCDSECCLADLDLDRSVGFSDLLLLLRYWRS